MDLTGIFNLSTLQSLDFNVYEHANLLQNLAPRLPNLQRLFICLDTKMSQDSDLFADNPGVVEAILTFYPLQYLCRRVRDVETLHMVLERHGATLKGLLFEPTKLGRAGRMSDFHYKHPSIIPTDVRRIAESGPLLCEL
jgi:hypothetical protein